MFKFSSQVVVVVFISLVVAVHEVSANPRVAIAVSYFDNTSKDEQLNPLKRGLAEMLITDLSVSSRLQIVERERLNDVLKEVALQKSPYMDPRSAVELGKGLGAAYILTGSYILSGDQLRIDCRMVDVATAEVALAVSAHGAKSDFLTIQRTLATQLLEGLGEPVSLITKKQIAAGSTGSLSALTAYSTGLVAQDNGDEAAAKAAFANALKLDPGFAVVKARLDQMEKRLQQVEAKTKETADQIDAAGHGRVATLAHVKRMAEAGDAEAQYLLGIAYTPWPSMQITIWGAQPNTDAAIQWFERAAAQGMHQAGWWGGVLSYNSDKAKSKKLLQAAVEDGSPCMAQYSLALSALSAGEYAEGLRWLTATTKAGFASKNSPPGLMWPIQDAEIDAGSLPFRRHQSNWTVCKSWTFRAMIEAALVHRDHNFPGFSEAEYVALLKSVAKHPEARRSKKFKGKYEPMSTYAFSTNLLSGTRGARTYKDCDPKIRPWMDNLQHKVRDITEKSSYLSHKSAAFESAELLARHFGLKATRDLSYFSNLRDPGFKEGWPSYYRGTKVLSPAALREAIKWTELQVQLLETNEFPSENTAPTNKIKRLKEQLERMNSLL